ncbi:hypothetical protein TNCT6_68790 [Streptomyces sp. 6-11-2]|nr:hypothetical protein TNCT6_68790 [Streptomyces sp. 6-11-2]
MRAASAVGLTRDQARGTLRLSLGRTTTDNDVVQAAGLITQAAHALAPVAAGAAWPTRTGRLRGTIPTTRTCGLGVLPAGPQGGLGRGQADAGRRVPQGGRRPARPLMSYGNASLPHHRAIPFLS